MDNEQILIALNRIAGDVEKLIAALSDAPAPKAEAPKPAPAKTDKPASLESVRAVLTKLAAEKGAERSRSLLKEYGATKLSDVKADDYAALMRSAEEELAE